MYKWDDATLRSLGFGRFLSLCERIEDLEYLEDRRRQQVLAPLVFATVTQNSETQQDYKSWLRSMGLSDSMLQHVLVLESGPAGVVTHAKLEEASSDEWGATSAEDLSAWSDNEMDYSYDESEYEDDE